MLIFRPIPPELADATRTIEEIIISRGFKVEVHEVTTKDGYILTLHRIVNPALKTTGYPVLCMHGFGGAAENFITAADDGYLDDQDLEFLQEKLACTDGDLSSNKMRYKEYDNNLGFCLAKKGYDVWLGNLRATKHSRKHRTLSLSSESYWDFSLDEQVAYDLPSFIEKVLKVNGSKTLGYIGISMGTTIMFGLLSSQPRFNEIVKPFIAMAPCYRLFNMRSPYKYCLKLLYFFYQ